MIKTIAEYASINDNTSIQGINFAVIQCTPDERCPFLDAHHLCAVQKRSGENALSNVCALYPRYYNKVDGVYEESLSLACLEAAETLLLGAPLELVEIDRPPKKEVIMQTLYTKNDDNGASDKGHLYDFRESVFDFMRSTAHTIDEKLTMLMTFHNHIEGMNVDMLKASFKAYDFTYKYKRMSINDTQTHIRSIDQCLFNKLIDFSKRVGKSGHTELDHLIFACINQAHYDHLELAKLSRIDQIMSNYIIHQMFKDLYPFICQRSKLDSFEYIFKKVQILRLLIAYAGRFDDKSVVRIIQMYSKGLEHHAVFHYELDDLVL